ncbi:MAG: hypothetical protein ACFFCB_04475 [Candidatus Odinarchaeota archaeon]
MCGSKGYRHGFMGPAPFFRHMWCDPEFEPSKKSQIKSLEAMKAKLEDHIQHIDERIKEIEKEKKGSA